MEQKLRVTQLVTKLLPCTKPEGSLRAHKRPPLTSILRQLMQSPSHIPLCLYIHLNTELYLLVIQRPAVRRNSDVRISNPKPLYIFPSQPRFLECILLRVFRPEFRTYFLSNSFVLHNPPIFVSLLKNI